VWAKTIREVLAVEGKGYEPRGIITPAKEAIISVVKRKMAEFDTSGKA
jgi:6-phospho-5-dehydro-2-deoxy-D-gluconate aldolase